MVCLYKLKLRCAIKSKYASVQTSADVMHLSWFPVFMQQEDPRRTVAVLVRTSSALI